MIFLGIDPGYGTCGFGVLQKKNTQVSVLDYGVITTDAGLDFSDRLCEVAEGIEELLHKYSPTVLSLERLFWGANVDNAIRVAEARGVIEYLCRKQGLHIMEYSPNEVKSKLVGHGKAPKFQLQNIITMRLGLKSPPQPDDAADGLCLAFLAQEEYRETNI